MCAICNFKIEFGVGHPLALSIATATRNAIESGLLNENKAGACWRPRGSGSRPSTRSSYFRTGSRCPSRSASCLSCPTSMCC
ncbi:hypothetical protein PSAC2689_10737 [Paraburkholderia sacchari]